MAELLLGNRYCIESLLCDVRDIQATVNRILSFTGPIKAPSWKYPDQQACQVDSDSLLDRCAFSDDDDGNNQVSHVILLEMVIDRFLLLLQLQAKFLEMLLPSDVTRPKSGHQAMLLGSSIGVAVRRHWERLHSVTAGKIKAQEDRKPSHEKNLNAVGKPEEDDHHIKREPTSSNQNQIIDISTDFCTRASQTDDSASVPCENCLQVQDNLRKVGTAVTEVCKESGLPSALGDFMTQFDAGQWLSLVDLSQWCTNQQLDLTLLCKHYTCIQKITVKPLQDECSAFKEKCKGLEKQVANLTRNIKKEEETSSIQLKQHYLKQQELENKYKGEIVKLSEEKSVLLERNKTIGEVLENEKCTSSSLRDRLTETHAEINALEEKLVKCSANDADVRRLAQEQQLLQMSLTELQKNYDKKQSELSTCEETCRKQQTDLDKVNGEVEVLKTNLKQLRESNVDQSTQLNAVIAERNKLYDDYCTIEKKHSFNSRQIETVQRQVEEFREEKCNDRLLIKKLKDEVMSLTSSIKNLEEREKLLLQYPDLYGPIKVDLNGNGDVKTDMEKQILANNARINLLEQQNDTLQRSIAKLAAVNASPILLRRPDDGHLPNAVQLEPHVNAQSNSISFQKGSSMSFQSTPRNSLDSTCLSVGTNSSGRSSFGDSHVKSVTETPSPAAKDLLAYSVYKNASDVRQSEQSLHRRSSSSSLMDPDSKHQKSDLALPAVPAMDCLGELQQLAKQRDILRKHRMLRFESGSSLSNSKESVGVPSGSNKTKPCSARKDDFESTKPQAVNRRTPVNRSAPEANKSCKIGGSASIIKLSSLNTNSINTYIKLKRFGLLKTEKDSKVDAKQCEQCRKVFDSLAKKEQHRYYCPGPDK